MTVVKLQLVVVPGTPRKLGYLRSLSSCARLTQLPGVGTFATIAANGGR